jgi:hypothetical protein
MAVGFSGRAQTRACRRVNSPNRRRVFRPSGVPRLLLPHPGAGCLFSPPPPPLLVAPHSSTSTLLAFGLFLLQFATKHEWCSGDLLADEHIHQREMFSRIIGINRDRGRRTWRVHGHIVGMRRTAPNYPGIEGRQSSQLPVYRAASIANLSSSGGVWGAVL